MWFVVTGQGVPEVPARVHHGASAPRPDSQAVHGGFALELSAEIYGAAYLQPVRIIQGLALSLLRWTRPGNAVGTFNIFPQYPNSPSFLPVP